MRGVFRRSECGWSPQLDLRLFRILLPAAVIAVLTALAWLLLESASMGGAWGFAIDQDAVRTVLTDTAFGRLWLGRLPLAVLVCLTAWFWRRLSFALPPLAALLLASLALTGHAIMNTGWLSLVHPLNQALHLLAAGLWLGGLVPLGLLLAGSDRSLADRALRRFSDLAFVAVLVVLGSGVFNAWLLVGSFPALIATNYGATLLVKLALVGTMITLALSNRFLLLPSLAARHDAALSRLERNVLLEIILGALVLAAASLLGNLPPAHM